jgi:hypothetical protein
MMGLDAPDHGGNVEADAGGVEKVLFGNGAVIDGDYKRALEGNDDLLELHVGVTATDGAYRDIVSGKETHGLERKMARELGKHEVAAGIGDEREIKEFDSGAFEDARENAGRWDG